MADSDAEKQAREEPTVGESLTEELNRFYDLKETTNNNEHRNTK